jgi:uncharacterized membrane protein
MFKPNIDLAGRCLRGLMGLALLGVAGVLWVWQYPWIALLVAGGGVFALFEAAIGWCAARACGIKTRI